MLKVRLVTALSRWIESGEGRGLVLLPTDVVLDEYNVCVEIRSPSTRRYDVGAKKAAYEAGGLPELWLVDHVATSVLVFRRSAPDVIRFDVALELGRGDSLTSPQLPGFELALDELFRD